MLKKIKEAIVSKKKKNTRSSCLLWNEVDLKVFWNSGIPSL